MIAILLSSALAQPIPDGDCACFVGRTVGNDVVDASVRVCRAGERLVGGFDWSGRASGRSFRVLEGRVEGDALALHDTALPVARPEEGWRFCSIDAYHLVSTPDGGLRGTYDSAACGDHATVELTRRACAVPPPAPRGPRPELVPDEVQACRDRGVLWLSDPDYYERTEIDLGSGWVPVWQVLDRYQGRAGYLLVYPQTCRVMVGVAQPSPDGGEGTFELVPPPGTDAWPAEEVMLRRWARRW